MKTFPLFPKLREYYFTDHDITLEKIVRWVTCGPRLIGYLLGLVLGAFAAGFLQAIEDVR